MSHPVQSCTVRATWINMHTYMYAFTMELSEICRMNHQIRNQCPKWNSEYNLYSVVLRFNSWKNYMQNQIKANVKPSYFHKMAVTFRWCNKSLEPYWPAGMYSTDVLLSHCLVVVVTSKWDCVTFEWRNITLTDEWNGAFISIEIQQVTIMPYRIATCCHSGCSTVKVTSESLWTNLKTVYQKW